MSEPSSSAVGDARGVYSAPPKAGQPYNPWRLFHGVFVPNWLARRPVRDGVSQGAKLCFGQLVQHAGQNGLCFPSLETLAEELGVSRRAVDDYVKELRTAGLIEVTRRGLNTPNLYDFLWHRWITDDGAPATRGGSQPDAKNTTHPEENRRLDAKNTTHPVANHATHPDAKNTTHPIEDEKIHLKDPSPQAYGSTGGPPPERLRGEPLSKGKAENRPVDVALLAQNSRKTNQDRNSPQPPSSSEQARLLPPALPEDWRAAALELKSRMRTPDLNATEIQLLAGLHANGVPLEAVVNTVETGLTAAGKIISRLYYFEGPLRDLAAGKQVANGNGNGGVDRKRSDFERRYDWGPNPPPIARLLPQHGFSPRPPGSEHYPGERPWAKVEELIATGGGAVTVEEWARLRKMGIVAS